jgi:tellurite resistance protein
VRREEEAIQKTSHLPTHIYHKHKLTLSMKALIFLSLLLTETSSWAPHSTRHVLVSQIRAPTHLSAFKTKQKESKADTEFDESSENDKKIQEGESVTVITESNGMEDLIDKLFLGIEPTPEVLSIMAIYFVEGALGLARLAQTFFLKDELHLGPAELSALTGLFTLPWTIKVSQKFCFGRVFAVFFKNTTNPYSSSIHILVAIIWFSERWSSIIWLQTTILFNSVWISRVSAYCECERSPN